MRVRDLMSVDPATCLPADSCGAALTLMASRRCGFLPVIDGPESRRVVGVVTDRDIAMHLGRHDAPASAIPVEACMSRGVCTVGPDEDLEQAVALMETGAFHRLPVVDRGCAVGVLSLKDLARVARQEWSHAGPHMVERQLAEIIEAIAAAPPR